MSEINDNGNFTIETDMDIFENLDDIVMESDQDGTTSSQPNSQEMDAMVTDAVSVNTKRSTDWGVKKFRDWCNKR